MMKRFALSLAIAAALATGAVAEAIAAGPADSHDSSVRVTVKYTGKGPVDETHRVWLWLFDTPDIGPGSMPIAELSIGKNGDTAIVRQRDRRQGVDCRGVRRARHDVGQRPSAVGHAGRGLRVQHGRPRRRQAR